MTDAEMISCQEPGEQLARLRAIMHRLRAPSGCPWDAEQTHESLISNLLEESHETIDAIRRHDLAHLKEELGDLLLQVFFHSELAQEAGNFSLDDVAKTISEKLIRRHPHVFGTSCVNTTQDVLNQWDAIKLAEGKSSSKAKPFLHKTGHGLPSLLRSEKIQKKVARVGFDWPDTSGVVAKIREETEETQAALNQWNAANLETSEQALKNLEGELGDLLFSVVNLARKCGISPELALENTNRKFETRFHQMDLNLRGMGLSLESSSLEQMESQWICAKSNEKTPSPIAKTMP